MPNRFALPREAYKCKAPLDAHQLPIYLFLLQYLTCNSAEPDQGTGKEEEQRRGNRAKIERKTRQPAATPVKTVLFFFFLTQHLKFCIAVLLSLT